MGPARMDTYVTTPRPRAACQLTALVLVLSCQGAGESPTTTTPESAVPTVVGDVGHAAALLQDGTILVSGGNDAAGTPVSTARRYDPATDTEIPVGAMTTARSHAQMTLLLDGRVLVSGGTSGAGELGSLEVFDPQTGAFTALASRLNKPRQGHFATAMTDGHVLIKGGTERGSAMTIAELFDSADETVGPVGSLDGVRLASVKTERGDYSPFEHAHVTGGGWDPGETVALLFDETPFEHWPHVVQAVADENGNIDNQDFALEPHDLGTSFVLTATGTTSGQTAQTTFTDSTTLTYAPATQSVSADAGGVVGAFTQTVTAPGGSGNFTTTLLVEGTGANPIPASWVTANPAQVQFLAVFGNAVHPWILTFTVPSGTATGVYTADIKALASSSAVLSGTGTAVSLTVNTSDGVPVPDAHGPYTVGEQGTVQLGGTARDADDTLLTFTWDLDGDGSFETSGASPTFSAAGRDGPTSQAVTLKVCDPGLHCATAGTTVTITNVAPTATFHVSATTVNEGSPFSLSMTGATDVAAADVAAGFTYAFDCGAGYAPASAASTANCTTIDNVALTVGGKVFDKDGGSSETRTTVSVVNVPPTATFVAPASVPEGSAITLALTNATDPGPNDISTLRFAFDCGTGSGLGGFSTTATATCPTTDNGTRAVRGAVRDKNGGTTTYDASVTVSNVAPSATVANGGPVNEASPVAITVSGASDPSTVDTAAGFHYAFACDGSSLAGATYATSGTSATTSCLYADNGAYTVRARVLDKDGGAGDVATVVTVNDVAPTATLLAPAGGEEGAALALSLTAPSDPSSVDVAAGFQYAFDCGDGAGYGPASNAPGASCVPADNGTYAVRGKILDKDGGASEYGASVVVTNVAPTGTLANDGPVGEGSPTTVTFTASDASPADRGAGLHYAFACDGAPLDGATYATSGTSAQTTCSYDDQGIFTVSARVFDKDGGATELTTTVTVNDVAPTATFAAPGTVDEGAAFALTLSAPVDPSTGDTTAGFTYAFDCGAGAGYGDPTSSATATCTPADSGTVTVRGKIIDKDGGASEYQAVVEVENVAPTATLVSDGPIDEGGSVLVHAGGAFDPSAPDTAAGFHYAFSCTGADLASATYATSGTAAQTTCAFDDQGSFTVRARIIDKDGGFSEMTTTVSVNDVAPTAAFSASSPIGEGGSAVLSFEGAFDPSGADTTAGFRFAYACDGGSLAAATYATASAEPTASCAYDDNGTVTVRGRIIEKDDGFTEYTAVVLVLNVPPSATLTNAGPIDEGGAVTVSLSDPTDPSAADTGAGFTVAFACDGVTFGDAGSSLQSSCAFGDSGSFTVLARVTDKDGGATTLATVVAVRNVAPTATLATSGPIVEGGTATVGFTGATDPSAADLAAGLHYAFSCDGSSLAGVTYASAGASPSIDCSFADDGDHAVLGRVIDQDDGFTEASATVTVTNAAPVISGTTGPEAPVQVGDIVDVTATFTDAGASDGHDCAISWGDAEQSVGTIAGDTCSGSHVYTVAGTFTVEITVTDDDGAAASATRSVEVDEEPLGGFTTGGGWFQAPAGSDPSLPSASGRAFFAFVAVESATVSPFGVTAFLFLRAGFDFASVDVDSLTVEGGTAVYGGSGTVNGQGGYAYSLTAVDGQAPGGDGVDRLRMRIWNAATGATLFDNGSPTAIAAGSIEVHPAD